MKDFYTSNQENDSPFSFFKLQTKLSYVLVVWFILMAFSLKAQLNNDWKYKVPITINNSFIDENLSDWTLVFDQSFSTVLYDDNGPLDADGSAVSLNGGADIRFSSDSAGINLLARDIRRWETNNSPSDAFCEVAVKIPTVNSGSTTTIYMWWGNAAALEPDPTDDYGQYNAYNEDQIAMITGGADPSSNFSDRLNVSWTVPIGGKRPLQELGILGMANSFEANNSALEAVNESVFDGIESNGAISMMAIVKPVTTGPTSPNFRILVSRGNAFGSTTNYYVICHDRINDQLEFPIQGRSPADRVLASSIGVNLGSWYAFGVNGEDPSTANLIIDGVAKELDNDITGEISLGNYQTNTPFRIGLDAINTGRGWRGLIDELRIFKNIQSVASHKAFFHNLFQTSGFLSFGSIDYCVSPVAINIDNIVPSSGTGSNGAIDLTITNGTAPYTVQLNETFEVKIVTNDGGSCTFNGLDPGTYSISVSDNNSCTVNETNIVILNEEDCHIGFSYSYKLPISINNDFIEDNLDDWTLVFDQSFSSVLTDDNGPLDADGTAKSLMDGADVRFSSDAAGNNVLARDIRQWEINSNPIDRKCEIAVKIPFVNSIAATTIYMWWGNDAALEPDPTDDCGQYNAYDEYFVFVSPSGGDNDRTANQTTAISAGVPLATEDAPTGKATEYFGGSTGSVYFGNPNGSQHSQNGICYILQSCSHH